MTDPCIDGDQFFPSAAGLTPQFWMQWRQVASFSSLSREGTYPITGGAKNDVLHTVTAGFANVNSPLDQWVYGVVTRGGCRITLQAKSRGYFKMSHAMAEGTSAGAFTEVSRVGCGLTVGKTGLFAADQFGMTEVRQNALSMPLMPQITGWHRLASGATLTASVELRFVSDFWQTAAISGGDNGTESSYSTGETRLDLYAVPVLEG